MPIFESNRDAQDSASDSGKITPGFNSCWNSSAEEGNPPTAWELIDQGFTSQSPPSKEVEDYRCHVSKFSLKEESTIYELPDHEGSSSVSSFRSRNNSSEIKPVKEVKVNSPEKLVEESSFAVN